MTEQDTQQNRSLTTVDNISPGELSIDDMRSRADRMTQMLQIRNQFILDNMKEGVDYGTIPGCGKERVLLKPGAEKLKQLYGYYSDVKLMNQKEDWDAGIFAYVYRCEVKQIGTGHVVGTCEGDASSHENKYRYQWMFESQLPDGVDKNRLTQKKLKNGAIMYRTVVENPADRRNTLRKMAQKRAMVGAVLDATGTSSIFRQDIELPEDDDDLDGVVAKQDRESGSKSPNGKSPSNDDHGNPISEKQARRLFAIRKEHGIEDDQFSAWLKAKYGYDSDREIGWKVYEEICKAVEAGDLEIPEEKPAETKSESKPAGKKIGVAEIKSVYAVLNENKLTEAQFKEWLDEAFPQLKGSGIADLPADNFDDVFTAFKKYVEEA